MSTPKTIFHSRAGTRSSQMLKGNYGFEVCAVLSDRPKGRRLQLLKMPGCQSPGPTGFCRDRRTDEYLSPWTPDSLFLKAASGELLIRPKACFPIQCVAFCPTTRARCGLARADWAFNAGWGLNNGRTGPDWTAFPTTAYGA